MSTTENKKKQHLGYQLKLAQHALRLRMDEVLRSLALTTPQYAVLSQLELDPGRSNASLARASFVTAQTMHGIVSNLEKNKLIKRLSDPHHGRKLRTKLTAEGVAALEKARELIDAVEKEMTATLTKKDIVMLEELLAVCVENLVNSEGK